MRMQVETSGLPLEERGAYSGVSCDMDSMQGALLRPDHHHLSIKALSHDPLHFQPHRQDRVLPSELCCIDRCIDYLSLSLSVSVSPSPSPSLCLCLSVSLSLSLSVCLSLSLSLSVSVSVSLLYVTAYLTTKRML